MGDPYFLTALFAAFSLHLIFGCLGVRFERFSRPWGRCLYIPVLLTIALRRVMGLGVAVIPWFFLLALLGQALGRWIGKKHYAGPIVYSSQMSVMEGIKNETR